ncbi:ATP-binding protein [Adlercreutzia sp. ZJ141]|uniref:ATP-binding protein n=1 Tax=Adlercreutzia sp. ZJ141 TaxID=2709406 RepID=UPI0013ECB979|nr:ATP-binding protein [Adlercreutzia sp. ZJ141]
MKQAINVPFKLDENSQRVDETEAHDALREAIANCLTNADYHERRGVVFLWREDGLRFSNPGGFRIGIEDVYIGGNSDPRNETMMKMFTLINIGERAGGGVPDMVKKWTYAGFGRPVLSEQVNPERSSIFLPLAVDPVGNDVGNVGNDVGSGAVEHHTGKNVIRTQSIADNLGMSKRHIERVIAGLRKEGVLVREGGTRGRWIIAKN